MTVEDSTLRVRVLGAGIIGLTCALELGRRGHRVEVVDPAPGSGASWAAAGMLSPAGEAWHGEADLLRTGRRSADLWPELARDLGVPLRQVGTMLVAHDAGDAEDLGRLLSLLTDHGEPVERLASRDARVLEPALARGCAGAALLPRDHSVDPRAVVRALRRRCRVVPAATGPADVTVVATGTTLPPPFAHLVRGVRGEVVRAHCPDPPRRTLRGWVRGTPVYVVPRPDGEVVIGATQSEHAAPPVVTLEGLATLLVAARTLLPGLDRATFGEAVARDRPASVDHRPLVGATHLPEVLLAAGHHRHGVLLAPLTAVLIADHLDGGASEPSWDPRRFDTVHPPTGPSQTAQSRSVPQ
ncbi:FAD-dependent oxidoreductase [Nocardioides sp. 616]|uniref:FAD-dependent oxidoreductase n=1 Tax=Nocardioides sp. 616 TaxID=2268090 RepID=UPI000CE538C0|nr:FAD-dependent oxidoreductase [Nocardioides sp. 616]